MYVDMKQVLYEVKKSIYDKCHKTSDYSANSATLQSSFKLA